MVAKIVPPTPKEVGSLELQQWFGVFRPDWETLVALEYVDGGIQRALTFCQDGLDSSAGLVGMYCSALQTGSLVPPLTSGVELFGVSTSASDTAICISQVIDSNGDQTQITWTLNGTTPVSLGTGLVYAARISIISPTLNVGEVYISTKAEAGLPAIVANKVQVVVPVGANYGCNPIIRGANGKTLLITDAVLSGNSSPVAGRAAHFTFWFYGPDGAGDFFKTRSSRFYVTNFAGSVPITFASPVAIPANFSLGIEVNSVTSTIDLDAIIKVNELGKSITDPQDNKVGMDTLFFPPSETPR